VIGDLILIFAHALKFLDPTHKNFEHVSLIYNYLFHHDLSIVSCLLHMLYTAIFEFNFNMQFFFSFLHNN